MCTVLQQECTYTQILEEQHRYIMCTVQEWLKLNWMRNPPFKSGLSNSSSDFMYCDLSFKNRNGSKWGRKGTSVLRCRLNIHLGSDHLQQHTFLKFCEFGMISRMGKRSVLPRIPMPLRKHWHHTFCGCKTTGQCWRNRTRLLPLVKLPNWLVKNGSSWVMMRNLLVDLQRHQHFVLYYCDLSLK